MVDFADFGLALQQLKALEALVKQLEARVQALEDRVFPSSADLEEEQHE